MSKNHRAKYSPGVRERMPRMAREHVTEHASRWSAIVSIAAKVEWTALSMDDWAKQIEADSGGRAGLSRDESQLMEALDREVRELR